VGNAWLNLCLLAERVLLTAFCGAVFLIASFFGQLWFARCLDREFRAIWK
jgi:hypothetical protein